MLAVMSAMVSQHFGIAEEVLAVPHDQLFTDFKKPHVFDAVCRSIDKHHRNRPNQIQSDFELDVLLRLGQI